MTEAVARIRLATGVGSRLGWLIAGGLVVLVPLAIAFAARSDRLPLLAIAAGGALALVVSMRWPTIPLYTFAGLIPIEAVLLIGNLGTLSKFAGLLFMVAYGAQRLGKLTLSAMPAAAWGYIAWALLSLGWAIDADTAWGELSTLLQLFVIALLIADFVALRPTIVRPLLWVYSLSAALTGLLGILSFVSSSGPFGDRAVGLDNQDPAQFAVVLLPALVFSFFEIINGRWLIVSVPVALVTTGGVVVSGTRGVWLAVAIVVLLFILPKVDPVRRITAIVLTAILLLATLQLPGVGDMVAQRTETALSSGGAGRTDIWSVALNIYKEQPVLGVGYANFPVAYTADIVRESDVGTYSVNNPQGRGSHSMLVATMTELGPVGLLLLFSFIGPLVLRRGWGPDALVIQACLASLLTSAMFLDILANRKQVWLIIGIAAGRAYLARVRSRKQVTPPTSGIPIPASAAVSGGVPVTPGGPVPAGPVPSPGLVPGGLRTRPATSSFWADPRPESGSSA